MPDIEFDDADEEDLSNIQEWARRIGGPNGKSRLELELASRLVGDEMAVSRREPSL